MICPHCKKDHPGFVTSTGLRQAVCERCTARASFKAQADPVREKPGKRSDAKHQA